MEEKSFEKLYEEFRKILAGGTEEEARDFLVEHLKEFPKEVREGIIRAFVEESLERTIDDNQLIENFQREKLEQTNYLETIKRDLEDKLKTIAIKEEVSRWGQEKK